MEYLVIMIMLMFRFGCCCCLSACHHPISRVSSIPAFPKPADSPQQSSAQHLCQQPDAVSGHGAVPAVSKLQLCRLEEKQERGPQWVTTVSHLQRPASVLGQFCQHRLLQVWELGEKHCLLRINFETNRGFYFFEHRHDFSGRVDQLHQRTVGNCLY